VSRAASLARVLTAVAVPALVMTGCSNGGGSSNSAASSPTAAASPSAVDTSVPAVSAPPSPTSKKPAKCRTQDVKPAAEHANAPGSSKPGLIVTVTNISSRPCLTSGWIGVVVQDRGAKVGQVHSLAVDWSGNTQTILLLPGKQASTFIARTDDEVRSGVHCADQAGLGVIMPDDVTWKFIRPYPNYPVCTGEIDVTALNQ
jgi:Protein of unknown function (DUF4232)